MTIEEKVKDIGAEPQIEAQTEMLCDSYAMGFAEAYATAMYHVESKPYSEIFDEAYKEAYKSQYKEANVTVRAITYMLFGLSRQETISYINKLNILDKDTVNKIVNKEYIHCFSN
ncbi:MAG: hypothetical protein HDS11_02855 [Bacteroides sp.]|nr:hypothetical protein [Bacteroides sp.]